MTYKFITELDYNKPDACIDIIYKNIKTIQDLITKYIDTINTTKKDTVNKEIKKNKKINIKYYKKFKTPNISNLENVIISLNRICQKLIDAYFIKELHSKNEYKALDYDITYKITVSNSLHKRKLFAFFILLYSIEPYLTKKKYYVGIDYEFYKGKDIRLMQINCERKPHKTKSSISYIWIIKPDDLEPEMTKILIDNLMCHPKIYKIMNGADALDTPYMIKELFKTNKSDISKFFSTFIDLRYMCEYYKGCWTDDNKCDIYQAYLFFDVITTEKYNLLVEGNETVLEVCRSLLWEKSSSDDDIWNINKLDQGILYYVVFDVIYLKYHLLNIIKKSKSHPKFITGMLLVPFLTRLSMYEKHGITNITEELKNYADPINNFFFYKNDKIYKLIDTFKFFSENLILDDIHININNLLKVNYFRNYIMYIIKAITYYIFVKKYPVYVSRGIKYTNKYEINDLYKNLEKIGLGKLNVLCKSIYLNVEKKLESFQ